MTDDTTRLERIEQRAKALGWKYVAPQNDDPALSCHEHFVIYHDAFYYDFTEDNAGLTAAERLLSLWEPGAVVEIKHASDGDCSTSCAFESRDGCGLLVMNAEISGYHEQLERFKPGPSCPGPGKYKLVKVDDHEQK